MRWMLNALFVCALVCGIEVLPAAAAEPGTDDTRPPAVLKPNEAVPPGEPSPRDGAQGDPADGGPPNDDCALAQRIECGSSTIFNNTGASTDPSDPAFTCYGGGPPRAANTVWFVFRTGSTSVSLSLCNPGTLVENTIMAVYSGSCGALNEVACNDDGGSGCGAPGLRSRLTATGLTPGQDYYIQVASWSPPNIGQMELTLTCPINIDHCESAMLIECGASTTFDNGALTEDPTDPVFSCRSGGAFQGYFTAWFTFIATGHEATLSTCNPGTAVNDTLLAVYSGACGALYEIACNDDGGDGCGPVGLQSSLTATGLFVGQMYYVQVAGWDFGQVGQIQLTVRCTTPYDECAGALALACDSSFTFDNGTLTENPSDPVFSCRTGGAFQGYFTAWFTFVATTEEATLSTCNLGTAVTDTLLSIYSGGCGALTEIACNDDGGDGCGPLGFQSRLTAAGLTVGQTYYVQVAGWDYAQFGQIKLTIDCTAPYDDCAEAGSIACGSSITFDNSTFTTDPSDPVFTCHFSGVATQGYYTAWVTFVAATSRATLSTCNPGTTVTDTLLAVYSGGCGALDEIACNDDGGLECGPYRSVVTATGLTVGATYYVQVAGWDSLQHGEIELSYQCVTPYDDCLGAVSLACDSSVTFNNSEFTTDSSDPVFSCRSGTGGAAQGYYTAWFTFVATGHVATLSTCNPGTTVTDTLLSVYSGGCGALTEIACNDDGGDGCGPLGYQSRLTAAGLTVGQTYYVQVAGWNPFQHGQIKLSLECPHADCNANGIPDDQDIDSGVSRDCFNRAAAPGFRGGPDGVPDECECVADWNRDGIVNSTDVSDFVNTYFADQVNGTIHGDINCNGVSNSTDVSDFINTWFAAQAGQLPFAGCVI